MIIENFDTRERWNKIVIHLNKSEAAELRDALEAILAKDGPGRHEHIPSSDFQKEITVLISEDR
jgi:hypothetical protein